MTTRHTPAPGETLPPFTLAIDSGVNADLVPFCVIYLALGDGEETQLGQLSPNQVRQMALQWLGGAEAATSDAMVARLLTEAFALPLEVVAQAVATTRLYREQADAAGDEQGGSEMTLG